MEEEDVNNESVETQDTPISEPSTPEVEGQTETETPVEVQPEGEAQKKAKLSANERIQKILDREKKAQSDFEEYKRQHERAINLHQMLEQNPAKLQKVWEILQAKEEAQAMANQEDDYISPEELAKQEFHPEFIKLYTKNHALQKEIGDLKSTINELKGFVDERRSAENSEHSQMVDNLSIKMMQEDGFLDNEGYFKPGYEKAGQHLALATLSYLAQHAKNPEKPTREELSDAYKDAKSSMDEWVKLSMTKQKPTVPPTGTKGGQVPVSNPQKKYKGSWDHLADLL